jgi:flavin-dependent dehydrogenase
MDRYEVAIVGGGPAGLCTALFLANADPSLTERIVVLEKETYPRDKFCGGALGARADHLLRSIGVQVEVPSVDVAGLSLRTQDGEICERLEHIGRVVRRLEFDHELARIARSRGIRIQEGARVTKLAVEQGGATLETSAGQFAVGAVVGADGVGSFVRRELGLPAGKLRAQVIELDTEPVGSDRPRDVLHFDVADRGLTGYAWDFPTLVDGKEMVCRGVYHLKLDERPVDITAMLARRLADLGLSIEHYKQKRFAERGFEPHLAYAVPRVVLVGEAAGIDALSGEGIPQAVEYGAFAGPYLAEKIAARDFRFDDWTARFARSKVGFDLRFRERLLPYYFGRHRARLERHLVMMPAFVICSMEQFAGLPISNMLFARGVAGEALRTLRDKLLPWRRAPAG